MSEHSEETMKRTVAECLALLRSTVMAYPRPPTTHAEAGAEVQKLAQRWMDAYNIYNKRDFAALASTASRALSAVTITAAGRKAIEQALKQADEKQLLGVLSALNVEYTQLAGGNTQWQYGSWSGDWRQKRIVAHWTSICHGRGNQCLVLSNVVNGATTRAQRRDGPYSIGRSNQR